jgi:soluble lytic murein transglycosylase-like protein
MGRHTTRLLVLAFSIVAASGIAASRAAAEVFFFRDRGGVMHFTNVPTDSRYRVLWTGQKRSSRFSLARRAPLMSEANPPASLQAMIDEAAARYGVEPALVHAVVRAESDFDHLAISPAGARGLMQLMPGTASLVGVRNVFQPRENLDGGVYYLRSLIDRFSGSVHLAIAAYNAGPGAVEAFGGVPPYPETLEYVQRVFRFRQEYLRSHLGPLVLAATRSR